MVIWQFQAVISSSGKNNWSSPEQGKTDFHEFTYKMLEYVALTRPALIV